MKNVHPVYGASLLPYPLDKASRPSTSLFVSSCPL